jgi:hypothetical protein
VNIASFLIADAAVASNNITIINNVANSNAALDCSAAFTYLAGDLWTPSLTVAGGSSPVITAALQNVVPPVVAGTISYPQNNKPTGSVTLLEGTNNVGSGTLNGRLATFTINNITPGSHTYTAHFGGDTNYGALSFGTLTIVASSSAPVAASQSVNVAYNTATVVTLSATGSGTLTYSVVAAPTHGTLSGTAPNLTYTPTANYSGADSFTFKANNGTDSNVATVSITVAPAPPVAANQSVTVPFNTPKAITLAATGTGTITYTVQTQPAHGTLSGTAPSVTYTPAANYTGADSFTFNATNGSVSNTATVSLTVSASSVAQLAFTAAPVTPIAAGGNAGTVMVGEENSTGTVVTTASDAITLTVTGPSSYSQSYTMSAANGVATFNLTSVALTVPGTYTYTATASTVPAAQASESVTPGAVTAFTVAGFTTQVQTGTPGTVTVTARDSYGNLATNFAGTVTISSGDAAATLPAAYTYQPGDAGVHSFAVTLNTAGTQSITASSGSAVGTQFAINVLNSIWIINANGTAERLGANGGSLAGGGTASAAGTLGSIAFDNSGNAWAVESGTDAVREFSTTGTVLSGSGGYTAGGVKAPVSLFIDGLGQIWVLNGNNTLTVLSPTGAGITGSGGYQGVGINTPTGIAVDSAGSVWITNSGDNSVVKVIGAANPVTTPTVNATSSNQLGARP